MKVLSQAPLRLKEQQKKIPRNDENPRFFKLQRSDFNKSNEIEITSKNCHSCNARWRAEIAKAEPPFQRYHFPWKARFRNATWPMLSPLPFFCHARHGKEHFLWPQFGKGWSVFSKRFKKNYLIAKAETFFHRFIDTSLIIASVGFTFHCRRWIRLFCCSFRIHANSSFT